MLRRMDAGQRPNDDAIRAVFRLAADQAKQIRLQEKLAVFQAEHIHFLKNGLVHRDEYIEKTNGWFDDIRRIVKEEKKEEKKQVSGDCSCQ